MAWIPSAVMWASDGASILDHPHGIWCTFKVENLQGGAEGKSLGYSLDIFYLQGKVNDVDLFHPGDRTQ